MSHASNDYACQLSTVDTSHIHGRQAVTSPATSAPPRARLSATDERALEHQRLAREFKESQADTLRIKREKALQGSTEDADFLFALSLAEADDQAYAGGGEAFQDVAVPLNARPEARHSPGQQAVSPQPQTPSRVNGYGPSASSHSTIPSTVTDGQSPGKKKGIFKNLKRRGFGTRIFKKHDSDTGTSAFANGVPHGAREDSDDTLPAPVGTHPSPSHSIPLASGSEASSGTTASLATEITNYLTTEPKVQDARQLQRPSSSTSAEPASAAELASYQWDALDQAAANDGPDSSKGGDAAAYLELLQPAKALHADLLDTLANKEETRARLRTRGAQLQASICDLQHSIDTAQGWEAFSLASQQQADLEGRLRLGSQQQRLLGSCLRQLQSMHTYVKTHRPHHRDVETLQDVTFRELLHRLRNLEMDPSSDLVFSPAMRQQLDKQAASRADAETAMSKICQKGNDINFGAVVAAARHSRVTQAHNAADDTTVEEPAEHEDAAVNAGSRDDSASSGHVTVPAQQAAQDGSSTMGADERMLQTAQQAQLVPQEHDDSRSVTPLSAEAYAQETHSMNHTNALFPAINLQQTPATIFNAAAAAAAAAASSAAAAAAAVTAWSHDPPQTDEATPTIAEPDSPPSVAPPVAGAWGSRWVGTDQLEPIRIVLPGSASAAKAGDPWTLSTADTAPSAPLEPASAIGSDTTAAVAEQLADPSLPEQQESNQQLQPPSPSHAHKQSAAVAVGPSTGIEADEGAHADLLSTEASLPAVEDTEGMAALRHEADGPSDSTSLAKESRKTSDEVSPQACAAPDVAEQQQQQQQQKQEQKPAIVAEPSQVASHSNASNDEEHEHAMEDAQSDVASEATNEEAWDDDDDDEEDEGYPRLPPVRLTWRSEVADVDPALIDAAFGGHPQRHLSGDFAEGSREFSLANREQIPYSSAPGEAHHHGSRRNGNSDTCEHTDSPQRQHGRFLSSSDGPVRSNLQLHGQQPEHAHEHYDVDDDSDDADSDGPFHTQRSQPLECIKEETASAMGDTPSSMHSAVMVNTFGSGNLSSIVDTPPAGSPTNHVGSGSPEEDTGTAPASAMVDRGGNATAGSLHPDGASSFSAQEPNDTTNQPPEADTAKAHEPGPAEVAGAGNLPPAQPDESNTQPDLSADAAPMVPRAGRLADRADLSKAESSDPDRGAPDNAANTSQPQQFLSQANAHTTEPSGPTSSQPADRAKPTLEQERDSAEKQSARTEHVANNAASESGQPATSTASQGPVHISPSLASTDPLHKAADGASGLGSKGQQHAATEGSARKTTPPSPPPLGMHSERRAEERRKRLEKQAALEQQQKELEHRRQIRRRQKEVREPAPPPEPKQAAPLSEGKESPFAKESREAGPRVRFDLAGPSTSSAASTSSGVLSPGSYSPATTQRGSLAKSPQSSMPLPPPGRQRRSNSIDSSEGSSGGMPAGHRRTASTSNMGRSGSLDQAHPSRRITEPRAQKQAPSSSQQRRSNVELQMQRLEIMALLNDHRQAERNTASTLVHDAGRAEFSGSARQYARDNRARRERDPLRSERRIGRPSLTSDSASLDSCSEASSLASSRSPLEMRSRPGGKRGGSIPVMSGSAGLPTLSVANGDGHAASSRQARRSSDANNAISVSPAGFSSSAAAALSSTQAMSDEEVCSNFRALAAEIRLQNNVPLAAAASFLAEIRLATNGRLPGAINGVNWPSRKVAALGECIEGWQAVQHMTASLQAWKTLPDFSCSDECTRMETYLRIVKQNWANSGGSDAFLQKCNSAGVRWSADISVMLRRASLQLPKVYLELVTSEASSTEAALQLTDKLSLLRNALAFTEEVEEFAGGLDRECSLWRKRAQNHLASLERK